MTELPELFVSMCLVCLILVLHHVIKFQKFLSLSLLQVY